jgi:type IV pilus biogenesis protein CpaD/CtpE
VLLVALLFTSCALHPPSQFSALPRFNEAEQADVIIRYYSDDTSYLLKPAATEGAFMTILKKDAVLALAKQQPSRELAVVALIHYASDTQAQEVKHDWTSLLTEAGYRRIVFLHARNSMKVNGLPVLANGG